MGNAMPDEHLPTHTQIDLIFPTLQKRSLNTENQLIDDSKQSFAMISQDQMEKVYLEICN